MTYRRSIKEIELNEEPLASALAAVLPDPDEESPESDGMRWDNATAHQIRLLQMHPGAMAILGSYSAEEIGDNAAEKAVG